MASYRIYILGYKRPQSLQRLLRSLDVAFAGVQSGVNLTISLEHGADAEVKEIAGHFEWGGGTTEVIEHDHHLGLNGHIHKVTGMGGEQEEEFALFFEDDTFVHPQLSSYLPVYVDFLRANEDFFGASFYSYPRHDQHGTPFYPLRTASFFYAFQRVPSRGWMASRSMLQKYLSGKNKVSDQLPFYMKHWESGSWEKKMNSFLIDQDLQMVYPYLSLTTGFGEEGVHFEGEVHRFLSQSVLPLRIPSVSPINADEIARYDMFYEIEPGFLLRNSDDGLPEDLTIDLWGTKEHSNIKTQWVLTTNWSTGAEYGLSYGLDLRPVEQNVIQSNPGEEIRLIKVNNLRKQSKAIRAELKYTFQLHSQSYTTVTDSLRMKLRRLLGRKS